MNDEEPMFTGSDVEIATKLRELSNACAYAEELVEDDYLWWDASREYIKHHLEALMRLVGVSRNEKGPGG